MTTRMRSALLVPAALALGLTACAREINPNVVTGPSVGAVVATEIGWIESARQVQVQESDQLQGNTLGMVVGGATGGIVGSSFGHGWKQALATTAGVVAGATAGAVAQQQMTNQLAWEYVFRNEMGQISTIVQGSPPVLQPGQRAYLQRYTQGRARLVPIQG